MAKGYYYTVNGNQEEFQCPHCGWLVCNDERAWMVQCDKREAEFPVCSKSCDRADLESWEHESRNWYGPLIILDDGPESRYDAG